MFRKIFHLLFLLLFVGIALEAASFAAYWLLFSSSPYRASVDANSDVHAGEAIRSLLAGNLTIPHPYLGFVYDPREGLKHNGIPISSYGLIDDKSPIQKRAPEKILIGVSGGSVAWWLQSLGRDVLEAELRKNPFFQGKELVFIRLALGAYKQPQQLQELSYLLALGGELDLLLNIDGYNEVALSDFESRENHFFPHYWRQMIEGISDRGEVSLIGRIETLKEIRKAISTPQDASFARRSATARLLTRLADRYLEQRLNDLRSAHQSQRSAPAEASPAALGPELRYPSKEQFFEAIAQLWERSSIAMNDLTSARGIRYFHFLQPNQYVPGSKSFSESERSLVIDPQEPASANVLAGYPTLRKHGELLKQRGIQFFDATMIFKDVREATYNDACCHLSELGNEKFAAFIGQQIAEQMR